MMNEFINSQTGKLHNLVSWVVDRSTKVGYDLDTIVKLPKEDIVKVIFEMQPSNIKMITNFTYVFGLYAKYIGDEEAIRKFLELDRMVIWNQFKKSGLKKKRFISNDEFNDLIFNIEMFEELNSDWYSALFRCIYHGVYSEDLSAIKNLRGSDINTDTGEVHYRDDNGNEYTIIIPLSLAEDLLELSNSNSWTRRNRYGLFEIETQGLFPDSVFKIENRNDGNNYRYSYFHRIRKISKEYLDITIKPMNLYVSGIMSRLNDTLVKDGYDLEYVFLDHPRLSHKVLQDELNNSNYGKDTRYFRQMVVGHLEEFV